MAAQSNAFTSFFRYNSDSLLQQSIDYELAALAKFKLAQGQTNP